MKGQDSKGAYKSCGLNYSSSGGYGKKKSSSGHRRQGITGLEGYGGTVTSSSEWVDKRS